jgi:hypothetical protein
MSHLKTKITKHKRNHVVRNSINNPVRGQMQKPLDDEILLLSMTIGKKPPKNHDSI